MRDLNLWAHVGVLPQEKLLGQYFSLDFSLWIDLENSAEKDDISTTADYSVAIRDLQKLSFSTCCSTIEHFSDRILDCLENLYGSVPMQISLRKCAPPVSGFTGTVAIERKRHFPMP